MSALFKLLDFLDGKKTHILAFASAAILFAHGMGWIDTKTYTMLIALFGGGTVAALRVGVAKAQRAK
jgi:hypothetical protein